MLNLTSLGAGLVALALFAAPAQAQGTYRDFDRDNDRGVSQDEFSDGFGSRGHFDAIGGDDRMVDRDEFGAYTRERGDDFDLWGEDDFAEWDANQDEFLDEDEFNEGVYGAYDADEDGVLDENEYGDMDDDGIFG